ncbi:protein of unknown function [Nitrosotalea devaniterrae]|uniref:Uncharacterized protein n=1 Tax=Nitrosotalea devaniterrae TaxID=1078905 RepID=A0A128A301_9ARCH|nr:protein of unknown function [Candidatus Nitrosotalea devanaterra]
MILTCLNYLKHTKTHDMYHHTTDRGLSFIIFSYIYESKNRIELSNIFKVKKGTGFCKIQHRGIT